MIQGNPEYMGERCDDNSYVRIESDLESLDSDKDVLERQITLDLWTADEYEAARRDTAETTTEQTLGEAIDETIQDLETKRSEDVPWDGKAIHDTPSEDKRPKTIKMKKKHAKESYRVDSKHPDHALFSGRSVDWHFKWVSMMYFAHDPRKKDCGYEQWQYCVLDFCKRHKAEKLENGFLLPEAGKD
ncbi:MAG: hypothetical protein M1826_003069 [Phylliscum demangeonii]|nr:MAG: hypothetical protein M1826_003069 [Phylliscum demangeonii]